MDLITDTLHRYMTRSILGKYFISGIVIEMTGRGLANNDNLRIKLFKPRIRYFP